MPALRNTHTHAQTHSHIIHSHLSLTFPHPSSSCHSVLEPPHTYTYILTHTHTQTKRPVTVVHCHINTLSSYTCLNRRSRIQVSRYFKLAKMHSSWPMSCTPTAWMLLLLWPVLRRCPPPLIRLRVLRVHLRRWTHPFPFLLLVLLLLLLVVLTRQTEGEETR